MPPDWVSQPAALPPPGSKNAVYLLDLSGWVHRFFHATKSFAAGHVEEAIKKVLDRQQVQYFAVCEDSHAPTFREEVYPQYKAARREKRSGNERAQLLEQLRTAAELLAKGGAKRLRAKGFEADDVIATATRLAQDEGMRVVVMCFDKDMAQLVSRTTVLWDGKDRLRGPAEVEAEFGVRPDQMLDYLALVGDPVDGIPGVLGVGAVAAKKLLRYFPDASTAIAEAQKSGIESHPFWGSEMRTIWSKLYGGTPRKQFDLSRQLAALRFDVPIGVESVEELKLG